MVYDRRIGKFDLFSIMMKIGCIGFGGGNALIPVMQQKLVKQEKINKGDKLMLVGFGGGLTWAGVIIEYDGKMYIIDQHAAHEKVLYERFMERLSHQEITSQQMSPPDIVSLSLVEEEALRRFDGLLKKMGFSVSHFGGKDYAIDAIPGNLPPVDCRTLFLDEESLITEKVASMSCKAAVKGNHRLSFAEAEALIDELLTLENPYHCPHGRPTIISMTHYELDKRFKRIV